MAYPRDQINGGDYVHWHYVIVENKAARVRAVRRLGFYNLPLDDRIQDFATGDPLFQEARQRMRMPMDSCIRYRLPQSLYFEFSVHALFPSGSRRFGEASAAILRA